MLSLMRDFFYQYTDSYAKEYKLYNKLLDKISPETELLVSDPSEKDGTVLVSILHTHFFYSKQFSYLFFFTFTFL